MFPKKLKRVNIVIHLAWNINNKNYRLSKKNLVCQSGSLTLANSAIKAGVKKFIMIGSVSELEKNKDFYSKSKLTTLNLLIKKTESLYFIRFRPDEVNELIYNHNKIVN